MSHRTAKFQVQISSSSSGSDISSSSNGNETPASRFNQLLRRSVARHWRYLRYFRHDHTLNTRGRSVSDNGLCGIVDHDPDLDYLSIPVVVPRRSLQGFTSESAPAIIPTVHYTSAGGAGSAVGLEEASDGSDADRPRRGHHLRVPTPAFTGQSTGNFASGAAGGGCGAPRSAPATPLQLEPHPRKHDKTQVVKPFTGSAPSVRAPALAESGETSDGKQPYKSRQKKFFRHFPQVGPEERVLNYYSCALVGDLLLQGHLYITKNYFAFYSNVFGYVTKLLIPTSSVQRITKEKVARIIPNAVGVATRDERHVFGSLLSRDTTYKLMTHVWKNARQEITAKSEDLRASEVELDPSEYSDDSSSDHTDAPIPRPEPEAIIAAASAAVVQPNLQQKPSGAGWTILVLLTLILLASAVYLAHSLYTTQYKTQEEAPQLSGSELYAELLRWRARVHGRAAHELHAFLSTNLLLLTKVRQSLETLSEVILTDMAQGVPMQGDVPNDTVYS